MSPKASQVSPRVPKVSPRKYEPRGMKQGQREHEEWAQPDPVRVAPLGPPNPSPRQAEEM